jgi:transcriptional regulator with XRE-family HTH domain
MGILNLQEIAMRFGEHIKQRRLEMGLSLRAFCAQHSEDPSNWSKLERGMLSPPDSSARLLAIGHYLCYEDDSQQMREFFDLAQIERGQIPRDILENSALMDKLPLVFRTIRGDVPTEDELMRLADIIREAHTPDA